MERAAWVRGGLRAITRHPREGVLMRLPLQFFGGSQGWTELPGSVASTTDGEGEGRPVQLQRSLW